MSGVSTGDEFFMRESHEELSEKLYELSEKKEWILSEIEAVAQKLNRHELANSAYILSRFKDINDLHAAVFSGEMTFEEFERQLGVAMDSMRYSVRNRALFVLPDPCEQLKKSLARGDGLSLPKHYGLKGVLMQRGLITSVGAYTGVGKTTFLCNLAYEALFKSDNNKPYQSVFFSFEMEAWQVWFKIFALYHYAVKSESLQWPDIRELWSKKDKEFINFIKYAEQYLTVVDLTGYTARDMLAAYERVCDALSGEPTCCFVDYWQKIKPDNDRMDRRSQMIETVSTVSDFVKKRNTAWIIAAQKNRVSHKNDTRENKGGDRLIGAGDHSSFQESAQIEQDSGLCLMIGREQDSQGQWLPKISLNVSKNRFGKVRHVKDIDIDGITGFIIGDGSYDKKPYVSEIKTTIRKEEFQRFGLNVQAPAASA